MCELLEIFDSYVVPIRKLRFQSDPEQTLHGTDIVAFRIAQDGTIDELHFLECKLSTIRNLARGVEAHNQLVDDRSQGYADTLAFLGERLGETHPALFQAFLAYLADRDRKEAGADRRAGNRVAAHHHRTRPAWKPACALGVQAGGRPATQGATAGMSDRPYIVWKCAASLDGRIAAADGSSKWITSAEARADGHRLRAECGAVMVGSGTQQADDPQLAVRDAEVTRQPLRIVVDSNARTPASARVLDDAAPTVIAVADDADASHLEGRAEVVRLPRVDAGLDLELLLKALSERGVRAILLEGGPTLAGSFLAAGLIDRVVAYVAPVLIGGGGKPALAGPGAANIADAKRFQLEDVVRIGPDVRLTATPLR